NMERVVVARLRDAAFFLREDRKRPLASRVDDLAGVTFHQGHGTYRDKALRLEALVDAMGPSDGDRSASLTAARLANADLVTQQVREFTELQGVMGGLCLEGEGADRRVARAVRWHYRPVSVEPDAEPCGLSEEDQRVFAPVALADKIDTLAGYF